MKDESRKYVPYCTGEYDSDCEVCNGILDSKNVKDRAPCSWRDKCSAFRKYLFDTNSDYGAYVKIKVIFDGDGNEKYVGEPLDGREAFVDFCKGLVSEYNISKGIAQSSVDLVLKKRKPLKKARKNAIKRAKEKARFRASKLDYMLEHFKTHFIENLESYKFVSPRGIVRPGMLYFVDRRKTSKYISIYHKAPGVIGTPVALIKYKPRTVTFDVELPVAMCDFLIIGKSTLNKIKPRSISNGKFTTICVGLDKEKTAIVAQVIAQLIKKGKIKLPQYR